MTLVDTSVWVRFFKGMTEARFAGVMSTQKTALLHPLVFGELLLGGLSSANESLLDALPTIDSLSPEKIFRFIKEYSLPGKGIGWVDSAILCSAHEAGATLATFDEALRSCVGDMGIACVPKEE